MLPNLVFHVLLAAVDVAVLRLLFARRSPRALLTGGALFFVALFVLAGLGELYVEATTLYGPYFAFAGFLAKGLFVHLPVLLLGAAASLWHQARPLACLVVAATLADLLFAVYAFGIEPTWLEITHYEVRSSELTRPVRIVVIADLQSDDVGAYEARVLHAAMELHPDLILLAGDFLHTNSDARYAKLLADLHGLLVREGFRAPLGVFAVRGNVEHREWPEIFAGLPVQTFETTTTVATDGLSITALSLDDSFRTDLEVPAAPGFHIVCGHGPDFALSDAVHADLLVAGHTHGGQVRLPGFGPPITLSKIPRAWAAGRTDLPGGRTLIVSRGIGMERGYAPRLRFLCRPELAVIDLVPETGG